MTHRLHGRPPIRAVAVHGGPGAPGSVYALAAGLAQIVGTLEPFQSAVTVSGQIDELAAQIGELAVAPVFLVGHSWGAWLAFLLAHARPELVSRVILVNAGPFDPSYVPVLAARRKARLTTAEAAEYDHVIEQLRGTAGRPADELVSRLGALASKADTHCLAEDPPADGPPVRIDGAQYASIWEEASLLREKRHFISIAGAVRVPVRVIQGSHDPTPIAGVVDPLQGKVADLKWYEVPRCGHDPWREKYGRAVFWSTLLAELKVSGCS